MPEPRWRTGRRVGNTIYRQTGPEPSDDDLVIGFCVTASYAARLVEDANGADHEDDALTDRLLNVEGDLRDQLAGLQEQAKAFGLPPVGVRFRRPWTPHTRTPSGISATVKRVCNGCGQKIGDTTDDEILASIDGTPLRDVVAECPFCTPEVTTDG